MIGDNFAKNLVGISSSVIIQACGNLTARELRQKVKRDELQLQYSVIVIVIGGFQLMTQSVQQILDEIQQLLLTLRNKVGSSWIVVSTLMYRPRDELISKAKIDTINQGSVVLTNQLASVGCKCVTVKAHMALVSPLDNKLLRPIHVYFEDGLIPSKQAAYLLVRYFVVCVLEILGR